jgi:hypothetical protein
MKSISKPYDSRRTNRIGFTIGLVGWLLTTCIAVGAGSALNYSSPFLSDKGLSQDALNSLWRLALIPPLILGIIAWVLLIITRKAASASADPVLKPRFHSFLIGFVGWFVINSVLAFALGWIAFGTRMFYGPRQYLIENGSFLVMPVVSLSNIIVLIVFAFKHRMMALGILAAYAVNFAITVVTQVGWGSLCGVPLYLDAFPPFR